MDSMLYRSTLDTKALAAWSLTCSSQCSLVAKANSHKLGLGLVTEARHLQGLLHDVRVVGGGQVLAGCNTNLTGGEQTVCRQATAMI